MSPTPDLPHASNLSSAALRSGRGAIALHSTTPQQQALYDRLQAFSLDQPGAALSFSQRLARDNCWSLNYTQRVIEEYKKFAFLAVCAGHPVTPSDQVDQAWHQHLTYSRSYWEVFCPQVLQTPLHHEPTQGGQTEHHKFNDWYRKTLQSYEAWFGEAPPPDIWPDPSLRFGRDLQFRRVNVQQHWVLPRPDWAGRWAAIWQSGWRSGWQFVQQSPVVLGGLVVLALSLTSCAAIAPIPNPLDLRGPEFLQFYLFVLGSTLLVAWALRRWLRQPGTVEGQSLPPLDPYEVAYLVGGADRAIDTAIVSMARLQPPAIVAQEGFLVPLVVPEPSQHPLERAILESMNGSKATVQSLRRDTARATETLRSRLQALGLALSPAQAAKARLYPALLLLLPLLLGIAKVLVGLSRGRPVGFLLMMIVVWLVVIAIFQLPPLSSRYGERALQQIRATHQSAMTLRTRDLSAVQQTQLLFLIALSGTTALRGKEFASLRAALSPVSSTGSGSGYSSSWGSDGWSGDGGGGDGGGGGCGGCGG
ncbi:TIGR04222 domain-containing membrane protein [Thermoleptolyngbya sichuanensis XZ-Cy5]|uniref:TIGR04222 domain-containing membrane protein n=1 Tax=Thermoleptolyngbya sichuanensis TaxID=2885951 RepID=UPI00240E846D|nr:TIGR04222 domain-containing membrane protein [Thermoleptolyngbya sichuanensis]MDG2618080.1 TIGR04222 domain-containing membrane protein [Thermoleptolyngbya sichuanensis XZ-Cy5]